MAYHFQWAPTCSSCSCWRFLCEVYDQVEGKRIRCWWEWARENFEETLHAIQSPKEIHGWPGVLGCKSLLTPCMVIEPSLKSIWHCHCANSSGPTRPVTSSSTSTIFKVSRQPLIPTGSHHCFPPWTDRPSPNWRKLVNTPPIVRFSSGIKLLLDLFVPALSANCLTATRVDHRVAFF